VQHSACDEKQARSHRLIVAHIAPAKRRGVASAEANTRIIDGKRERAWYTGKPSVTRRAPTMTKRTATTLAASIATAAAKAASAPLIAAKVHASRHRVALEASTRCACFFCFRAFSTSEIKAWIDADTTALCPGCGVDAVLGNASGPWISDGFLRKMHQHYFAYRSK